MAWLSIALTLFGLLVAATVLLAIRPLDRFGYVSDDWIAHHQDESQDV